MAALVSRARRASEPVGHLPRVHAQPGLLHRLPAGRLFDDAGAARFLRRRIACCSCCPNATDRLAAAARRRAAHELARVRYLNTANMRLRDAAATRIRTGARDRAAGRRTAERRSAVCRSPTLRHACYGKSCPGSGSRAGRTRAFTRFISAISSAESSSARYGALAKPMPCSPLIDPSSATTRSKSSRSACPRARALVGVAAIDHEVDVDVAVAGVAEAGDPQAVAPPSARRPRRTAPARGRAARRRRG